MRNDTVHLDLQEARCHSAGQAVAQLAGPGPRPLGSPRHRGAAGARTTRPGARSPRRVRAAWRDRHRLADGVTSMRFAAKRPTGYSLLATTPEARRNRREGGSHRRGGRSGGGRRRDPMPGSKKLSSSCKEWGKSTVRRRRSYEPTESKNGRRNRRLTGGECGGGSPRRWGKKRWGRKLQPTFSFL